MTVKKIAVLVRNRQSEALRMALGLSLLDDVVDVYVLDHEFEAAEQDVLNIELMKEMRMRVYSNNAANPALEYLPGEEIARRLLEYDHILPY